MGKSMPDRVELRAALLMFLFAERQIKPLEAYYAMASAFKVTAKCRLERKKAGDGYESTFENLVRFARQDLCDLGLVSGDDYGLWELTDDGRKAALEALMPIVR